MAVQRRVNWISQQRVDVPDMRAVESSASNDFDQLIQAFVTGTSQGYILRGFEISMAGAIGGASSGLQLIVNPGAVMHIASSQSGTVYMVPAGTPSQQLNSATNSIIDGAFAPSAINYVGLEYERFIDDNTSSQVELWNPTTKNETTKNAPRAQILRYRIKITTSSWATNVLPIATITTDSGNNVVSITDARYSLFRLGTGGASPNPFYVYPWTAQSEGRTENPSSSSNSSISPFHGGDKMLGSLKDWMNALMTSIQEIKGTTYWYSPSSSGSLETLKGDLANTLITGRGHLSHSKITAGLLNWDNDIVIRVIGTRLSYTLLANPSSTDITLTEEQVAYVNLVRGVTVSPNLIFTNGSPIIQSVGAIAWTGTLQAGDWVKIGSATDAGYYEIQTVDSLTQVTLTENYSGTSTGAGGAKAKYAFGKYQTSPTPTTSRDIFIAARKDVPEGADVFWLFTRSDNGGTTHRVYVRFLGSEIEQGESKEISDTIADEILQYIGSPMESAYQPQYVSALNPSAVPQITELTIGAASTISSNQYFLINSSSDARRYYVWFNKDGTGVDPNPPATNDKIELAIATGQTAAQIALALASALSSTTFDDFTAVQQPVPNEDKIIVTNNSAGTCTDAVNNDVGAPFAISITQTGTGDGNAYINDGDNLTLAMKKLDQAIAALQAQIQGVTYDELVEIVASGATPPTSINGPVSIGTIIQLPLNSRIANAPQNYHVGFGSLQVYLNGQSLILGKDWQQVGLPLSTSNSIQTLQQLEVGDFLEFRIEATGGSGGGGGEVGPPGPEGPQGPPGDDAFGGPVAISSKTSDYTVQLTDSILLGNAVSAPITFTLPPASTATGQIFIFKKTDASVNAMTLQADGVEVIDGSNTQFTTTQYESFTLVTDGTAWYIL